MTGNPEDAKDDAIKSPEEEKDSFPGTEEQSASFLNNLRSSYTPSVSPFGFQTGNRSGNLSTSFQMPVQGGRFGLSAPFAFDESTATTIDGEKIAADEDDENDSQRRTERLKTGDTLRQMPDQEILEMKNKDRLIIYKSLGWIMEDGKGNAITRQVSQSPENPGDVSTFGLDKAGEIIAQCIELSGVTTIVFNNGDKIVFDVVGVSSISRKKESVFIREPMRKVLNFGATRRYRAF